MQLVLAVILLITCGALGGCETAPMTTQIKNGKVTLIAESVLVEPYGLNFKISGITIATETRMKLRVFAGDCYSGQGSLSNDGGGYGDIVFIDNLLLNGPTNAERLFTQLCRIGLPRAQQLQNGRTPQEQEQVAQRARSISEVQLKLLLQQQQNRIKQDRSRAIRDAGETVGEAIREQGKQETDCQPNGAGFTCKNR